MNGLCLCGCMRVSFFGSDSSRMSSHSCWFMSGAQVKSTPAAHASSFSSSSSFHFPRGITSLLTSPHHLPASVSLSESVFLSVCVKRGGEGRSCTRVGLFCGETCPSARSSERRSLRGVCVCGGVRTKDTHTHTLTPDQTSRSRRKTGQSERTSAQTTTNYFGTTFSCFLRRTEAVCFCQLAP